MAAPRWLQLVDQNIELTSSIHTQAIFGIPFHSIKQLQSMQKTLPNLSAIALACVLVACGGGDGEHQAESQTATSSAQDSASESASKAPAGALDHQTAEDPSAGSEAQALGLFPNVLVSIRTTNLPPLTVRVKGSLARQTSDTWPLLALRVNGVEVDRIAVTKAVMHDYVFATRPIPDGAKVELAFVNDSSVDGVDLNLFVEHILLNGRKVLPDSPGVVFDHGAGEAAFDGKLVQPGLGSLWWNGALRFTAGAAGEKLPTSTRRALYRYSAGYDADAFYTRNLQELGAGADYLALERTSTTYLDRYQVEGTLALHRYYRAGGDRLYTTNFAELGQAGFDGWVYEGVLGYCRTSPAPGTQPLYRFTGPVSVRYTKRRGEHYFANTQQPYAPSTDYLGLTPEMITCHPYTQPY
jgi:hypothetical protein